MLETFDLVFHRKKHYFCLTLVNKFLILSLKKDILFKIYKFNNIKIKIRNTKEIKLDKKILCFISIK